MLSGTRRAASGAGSRLACVVMNPEELADQSEVPRRVSQTAPEAITDPKGYYDQRYAEGYMQDFDDLFEACRLLTVRQILGAMRAQGAKPRSVLDYGCGEGRYLGILSEFFSGGRCDRIGYFQHRAINRKAVPP